MLIQKLLGAHPDTFATTVSHTTRKPRAGEVEGKAYFFLSESEVLSLVSQNAFLEHASFSGNYYGTSKQTVADQLAKGLIPVLHIDVQGVKSMKADPDVDARYVFIKPPSFESLEARLWGRSTEKEEDIQRRLARAKVELDYVDNADFRYAVIVNDDLENAYKELEEFVFGPSS